MKTRTEDGAGHATGPKGRHIMKLSIGHLYPDLLNLYGDRGNIQCMRKRCEWRGIGVEVTEFSLQDTIDFTKLDIVLLGGGSDREQQIVCTRLQTIRDDMKAYVEDGGSVIAVCGGYQLLGHYYETDDGRMEGLSLVDLYTVQDSPRLISNIVLKNNEVFPYEIVGFENHGGRTYTGSNRPFGEVVYGSGNNGKDGKEGCCHKCSICIFRKILMYVIIFFQMLWRENTEKEIFRSWMIRRKEKQTAIFVKDFK